MNSVTVSAPGKIVLSGEYAVLHGGPAVAAAVDRRARVTLQANASGLVEVEAPGFQPGCYRYRASADGKLESLDTAPEPGAFDLFERAWAAYPLATDTGVSVTLDTRQFVAADRKLGLGSSAALCVALTAALSGHTDATEIARRAGKVHREFQGGGSGVDVASAAHGGIILFRAEPATTQTLTMPSGLHVAVLWSGQPASTAERIRTLADGLQRGEGRATLDQLVQASAMLARCWQRGDAQELLACYPRYNQALQAFDADHNLDIYGAGHAELAAVADAAGLVYKPCGAGGGDVGVALSLEQRQLEKFVKQAAAQGFEALDVTLAAAGLRRD